MQESRDDSKRNKVGVTSLYVQDANGNFTFSGNYDTSYQHIPKANIGKLVAGAALTAAAMYFAQPELANMFSSMLGTDMVFVSALTAPQAGWLASGLASAVVGGAVAGVTGNDVLKSGALAGLGTAFYTALTQAATEAGGWANLRDQMKSGVTTAWDNALAKISPEVRSILGSTDVNSLINDTAQATTELANVGIDATNVASQATTAATNNANMAETLTNAADVAETAGSSLGKIELGAGVDPLTNLPTGIDPLKISTTTGVGQQAGQNALASYVTDPTVSGLISGAPIVPPTTGLDLLNSSQWANIGTAAGGSLLDQATNAIKNTWSSLPAWGQAALVGGGAKLGKDVIENLLTPNPKEVTYPSFTLNNPNIGQSSGGGLPTTMPDWWNNLYARQGVGAGQYLGYDIMKGLNVPADVMSLLGSSAPTTTPAPVATA
jgi:hypothetical protein